MHWLYEVATLTPTTRMWLAKHIWIFEVRVHFPSAGADLVRDSGCYSLLQLILPDKREVTLDEAALAALPQVEFETATPWTVGVHRYRGPTLVSVLAAQGAARANVLDVVALNGYRQRVDLPVCQVPLHPGAPPGWQTADPPQQRGRSGC